MNITFWRTSLFQASGSGMCKSPPIMVEQNIILYIRQVAAVETHPSSNYALQEGSLGQCSSRKYAFFVLNKSFQFWQIVVVFCFALLFLRSLWALFCLVLSRVLPFALSCNEILLSGSVYLHNNFQLTATAIEWKVTVSRRLRCQDWNVQYDETEQIDQLQMIVKLPTKTRDIGIKGAGPHAQNPSKVVRCILLVLELTPDANCPYTAVDGGGAFMFCRRRWPWMQLCCVWL